MSMYLLIKGLFLIFTFISVKAWEESGELVERGRASEVTVSTYTSLVLFSDPLRMLALTHVPRLWALLSGDKGTLKDLPLKRGDGWGKEWELLVPRPIRGFFFNQWKVTRDSFPTWMCKDKWANASVSLLDTFMVAITVTGKTNHESRIRPVTVLSFLCFVHNIHSHTNQEDGAMPALG